jgi:hypothetical protein
MFARTTIKKISLIALCILCVLLVAATWAGAAPGSAIIRRVIGSGTHLEQGNYSLHNSLGQPVTGRSSRGSVNLCSGYWCREIRTYFVYVPLVLRDY